MDILGISDELSMHGCLAVTSALFGYLLTIQLIPRAANYIMAHTQLHGVDMGKRDRPKLPESLGTVTGIIYLTTFLIFFVVAPCVVHLTLVDTPYHHNQQQQATTTTKLPPGSSSAANLAPGSTSTTNGLHSGPSTSDDISSFSFGNQLGHLAALASIAAMLTLGFIDDCYDLRWRYKLMFPFAASVPLLGIYYYSHRDRTTILVPHFLSKYLPLDEHLNLGIFYYIYMLMFVIFCTNAINIYAGINGLEVGQTIVLTVSVILYNVFEIIIEPKLSDVHLLSLQILVPFLACSFGLYKFNRFPARVFVGDAYCYFAGMTLAVVGILGHFSEEILIFAVPQVFNFLLSVPQLFKIVPCPRHRLPKFNLETGLREPSTFDFKPDELNVLGRIAMKLLSSAGFVQLTEHKDPSDGHLVKYTSNNLTLINLWLCWFGPMDERTLCQQLLRFQCHLSLVAIAFLTILRL